MNQERRAWLAELYSSNFSPVFRTCSRVLRNPDDAADASQEVFLIAADSLQPGTTSATARAWLQTVARNHCVDVLRRRKRLGRVLVTLSGDGTEGDDVAGAVADRDFVDGILKKLSPRERQALWQSAVEHRAIDDIAGRLRLSYMAAAQVIHRARRHAFDLAARVAIIFAAFRLGRSASRIGVNAARVAAVPMIAISAISMQSSGSPATRSFAHASGIPAASTPTPMGARAGAVPSGIGFVDAPPPGGSAVKVVPTGLPSNASSTITSAVSAVRHVMDRVSGLRVAPTPAVPVPSALPPLPSPPVP